LLKHKSSVAIALGFGCVILLGSQGLLAQQSNPQRPPDPAAQRQTASFKPSDNIDYRIEWFDQHLKK
jgi:hypothetical protein